MAKQKLTEAEIEAIRNWALERERQNHPGADVTIKVQGETDDSGNPTYSAVIIRERIVPRSLIRWMGGAQGRS